MQNSLLTTVLLPVALAIVMLGMGLSLVPEDFRRISRYPRAVALGSFCQIVVLPLIGGLLAWLWPMEPALAVGLVIVAICPGGPSSNLITYLAKGDVALSVTLTAISSVVTVFTIPVLANLALQLLMGSGAEISLPVLPTMLRIVLITLVPTVIGMGIRQRFTAAALRLEKQMGRLAAGLLALIILLLVIKEAGRLPGFIAQVGAAVVVLNLLGTAAGFLSARQLGLPLAQRLSIAIEVGIQNGTLAIAITAGLLNNIDMAVPAAIYSLWMNITGFAMVAFGRRKLAAAQGSVNG
ncbi:bile acid:sodium symporter family protein [Synechococcus sp. CS-1325]|uniref:bile acid:sodium symporter family protein n=1 Tax=Synechococcus sp. CS-1325 TaxID=2847979 RepID=UPI000DB4FBE9|nr:bile acid:sodium symporter family protein [Synechococcus sp. CS-1325]MCT0199635.1 bile acid:sodium symporter family protein [Synechococcus sp. CS-1325]PZU96645.1 MAG: bile acid:sodium symporter [Cyanobium sp.]